MNKHLILAFFVLLPFLKVDAGEHSSYKMPRTQVIPIRDTQSGRGYELYVKLPEKYAENKNLRYPVIYFTDAVWHIEMLSAATAYQMEDVILVGISWQTDNNEALLKEVGAHVSRFRDYSISKSSNPERQAKYQFGQASRHLDFIRKDVVKYIENNYRTDPKNRTYFGYSLGGEFGAYILLTQPDTFKNYILGSPSVRRDIPVLTKLEPTKPSKRQGLHANVFVSYGTLEKELGKYAEELVSMLKNKKDRSLVVKRELVEGDHSAAFPITGVRSIAWLSGLQKEGNE